MVEFFNIVLDIDADLFLDLYVERESHIKGLDDCGRFVATILA